jgi:hypothetical protein
MWKRQFIVDYITVCSHHRQPKRELHIVGVSNLCSTPKAMHCICPNPSVERVQRSASVSFGLSVTSRKEKRCLSSCIYVAFLSRHVCVRDKKLHAHHQSTTTGLFIRLHEILQSNQLSKAHHVGTYQPADLNKLTCDHQLHGPASVVIWERYHTNCKMQKRDKWDKWVLIFTFIY